MPIIIEVTGAAYPQNYKGKDILPMEGSSFVPVIENDEFNHGYFFGSMRGTFHILKEQQTGF